MSTPATTVPDEHREPIVEKRSPISSWHIAFFFVIIGLLVSGYLSYVKLFDAPMACIANGPFNCTRVQYSAYSRLFGIPIAWMGFGVYILLAILLILEKTMRGFTETSKMLAFGLTLFAWLFSMWLVYVQAVILEAYCQWCLMHEANITILFPIIIWRMWQELKQPTIQE